MENGIPEWLVVKWCGWEISSISDMVQNYAKKNWNVVLYFLAIQVSVAPLFLKA